MSFKPPTSGNYLMYPRRLLLLPALNAGLGLKLLILIGAEMIAVPPHQASAALLLADVAAGALQHGRLSAAARTAASG